MTQQGSPVWFITGCSTGFGKELAKLVLARGWRAVVTASVGVDDIGEQESSTVILMDSTKKLTANQRMQLCVFIDGVVDMNKQSIPIEFGQMTLKIKTRWWLCR